VDADGDEDFDGERFFAYDGNQIALAFDGDSDTDLTNRYLWGPVVDQILADEQVTSLGSAGDVIWPLTDHLGTARDLAQYNAGTDTTSITNHRVYDSFGNLVSETNAAVDHLFGFTARPWDEETDLQYNLNRWYDPVIGQWMSEDPKGLGPDSNVRRYVGNNAIMLIDPLGLAEHTTNKQEINRNKHEIAEAARSKQQNRAQQRREKFEGPAKAKTELEKAIQSAIDDLDTENKSLQKKQLKVTDSCKFSEIEQKIQANKASIQELKQLEVEKGGQIRAPKGQKIKLSVQAERALKLKGVTISVLNVGSIIIGELADAKDNAPISGMPGKRVARIDYEWEDEDGTYNIQSGWCGYYKVYNSGRYEGLPIKVSSEYVQAQIEQHKKEQGYFHFDWWNFEWKWNPGTKNEYRPEVFVPGVPDSYGRLMG
jgi:RHS repeat-associated protein